MASPGIALTEVEARLLYQLVPDYIATITAPKV
jgi:hypothetical protein